MKFSRQNRCPKVGSVTLFSTLLAFLLVGPAVAELREGEQAPAFIVTTPNGKPLDLSALKGQVVLVNIWATWCPPCLIEMPIIEKFYREHHGEGFAVIAISIDRPGLRDRVAKVLERFPFPGALMSDASPNGFTTPDSVPTSYVIDQNGIVRKVIDFDVEESDLKEFVLPLLKDTSVGPNTKPLQSAAAEAPAQKLKVNRWKRNARRRAARRARRNENSLPPFMELPAKLLPF